MMAMEVLGCNEEGILVRALSYTITLKDEEAAIILNGLSEAISVFRKESRARKEAEAAEACSKEEGIDPVELGSEPRP